MEAILTRLIQSQGIWAVLFVFLLLYTIKKNDKLDELQNAREKEYRELLLELTNKFAIVNEINSKLDNFCTHYTSQAKE
ncbi:BhlA holin family protein [Lachnospiraceae bacterium NK3A20]|nr:BhlA holin family protein [Lachnospiraceae bacterium NK3A20]